MNAKQIRITLLFILLVELISFIVSIVNGSANIAFILVCSMFLIVALLKPALAVFAALVELFIGGKGYLFMFDSDGVVISIRIAFFLILLAVWISLVIKNKKIEFLKSKFYTPYLVLAVFLLVGLVNAFVQKNEFSNIFFDFNAYLFFLYIPVFYDLIKDGKAWNTILNIAVASYVWLGIKTMFVLYLFSHELEWAVWPVYDWIRNSGVGEITLMSANIYRTFFQSHIYSLIGLIILTTYLILKRDKLNGLQRKVVFILMALGAATVLISLSRSFWAGALACIPVILVFAVYQKIKFTKLVKRFFIGFLTAIFAVAILFAVVRFPIPEPGTGSLGSLLKNRADVGSEAAAASRWNLLPELWHGIIQKPMLGSGFGAEITYISNDPRVRAYSSTGEYTTYAFEWGLLDIWYKIGIIGLAAYLWVILRVSRIGIQQYTKDKRLMPLALVIGLFALFVANFFTPYLNHPLGIGYILLVTRYLES